LDDLAVRTGLSISTVREAAVVLTVAGMIGLRENRLRGGVPQPICDYPTGKSLRFIGIKSQAAESKIFLFFRNGN
jgi:hypothetical protein